MAVTATGSTSGHNIPYPLDNDALNIAGDLQGLAETVDSTLTNIYNVVTDNSKNYVDAKTIIATSPIVANGTLGGGLTVSANATANNTPLYLAQRDSQGKLAVSAITIDTTASPTAATGTTWWSTDRETLQTKLNSAGVTLQHGQEILAYAYNNTASTITVGTVVMITGASGGELLVAPATNDGNTNPKFFLGIATQNLSANTYGFVTWFGEVGSLNTSSWTIGTDLYIGATGALTSTKPAAPRHRSPIAYVIEQNATAGVIMVRFNNGGALGDIERNVDFSGLANEDLISYDSSTGVWRNKAKTAYTWPQSAVTNLTTDLASKVPKSYSIYTKTDSYTLTVNDVATLLVFNNSATATCIIPDSTVAIPIGSRIDIVRIGAGEVTITTASGVTINGGTSLTFRAQWSVVTAIKLDSSSWLIVGDIL